VGLPDRLDSGFAQPAVAGHERKSKVNGCRGDDAIRHIGDGSTRYAVYRFGHSLVQRMNQQTGTGAFSCGFQTAQRLEW